MIWRRLLEGGACPGDYGHGIIIFLFDKLNSTSDRFNTSDRVQVGASEQTQRQTRSVFKLDQLKTQLITYTQTYTYTCAHITNQTINS